MRVGTMVPTNAATNGGGSAVGEFTSTLKRLPSMQMCKILHKHRMKRRPANSLASRPTNSGRRGRRSDPPKYRGISHNIKAAIQPARLCVCRFIRIMRVITRARGVYAVSE